MRALRGALAVLAVLFACGAPGASEEAARMEVTPQSATVGDPLGLTVTVEVGADARVELPVIGPELGELRVLSGSWQAEETAGERRRMVWKGTLAAYRTGEVTIPAIVIPVVLGGSQQRLTTEPVNVRIESVLPPAKEGGEPVDLADLKLPASIPADYRALVVSVAVLVGLLALTALLAWIHRRYGERLRAVPTSSDPFRRMPPDVWAYGELQRLLASRLAEEGKVDQFFEELARILKRYLEGRYRIDLLERTTEEVPRALEQAGVPATAMEGSLRLLALSDHVKFAGGRPDVEGCRGSVEEAYRLVDGTRPLQAGAQRNSHAKGQA